MTVFELKGDNKNYVQIFNSNFLKEAQLPLKAILFSNNLYISVTYLYKNQLIALTRETGSISRFTTTRYIPSSIRCVCNLACQQ